MMWNQKGLNQNGNRLMWLGAILGALLIALLTLTPMVAEGADAMAELYDSQGRVVGMAMMTNQDDGSVLVEVTVSDMNPVAGDRRMAIASVGMCETPDFTSAGDDVGTFPDIQFYSAGNANYKLAVEGLDLSMLADDDGSSLVIYADKGETAADAGARIICGIVAAPMVEVVIEEEVVEEEVVEEEVVEEEVVEEEVVEEEVVEEEVVEEEVVEEEVVEEEVIEEEVIEEEVIEEEVVEEEEPQTIVEASAGALLWDVQGRTVGAAVIIQGSGAIGVAVVIDGMDPIPGDHRLAITEQGVCDAPDYDSAGDEIGVLPDIQFYSSGQAEYEQILATDVTVADDILDADGSAVVIYADTGDDAGPRIICGILEPLDELLDGLGISESELQ